MADITTDINKIKEAVYGEEVRGSIVGALLAMNEQAEEAEEWATGNESGGTPSPTNNAKYYAERAQQVVNNKVDKIAGKGLSTNDYTNEDKQALAKAIQDISTLETTKANAESVREKFDEVDQTLEEVGENIDSLEKNKVDNNATADDLTSGATKQLLATTYRRRVSAVESACAEWRFCNQIDMERNERNVVHSSR